MEINYETLIAGIGCLTYLVTCLIRGAFWKQSRGAFWKQRTNNGGQWVSREDGPIFYIIMVLLFGALGLLLILEGLNII